MRAGNSSSISAGRATAVAAAALLSAIGCDDPGEGTGGGSLTDPCAGGACCVDAAACVVTDRVTLGQLTVDAMVTCPVQLGAWVSGGTATGIAPAGFPVNQCGLSWSNTNQPPASALHALDHHWLETTGAPIVVDMGSPVTNVFVFQSVDRLPFPEEGIESTVWGSDAPSVAGFPAGWTLAALTTIWRRGWEEPPGCHGQNNADDFTGEYGFPDTGFRYIAVYASGSLSIFQDPGHTIWIATNDDHGTPGWQSQDNEIDAVGTPVCDLGTVVASAGPDQVGAIPGQICFDGAGTLAGNGVATLSWDLDGDQVIDAAGATVCIPCKAAGEGVVRLYATDGCGCGDSATARWACVDNRPPDCGAAGPSVAELWPPDHGYRDVAITGVTDPDGDPVAVTITAIRQDEHVNRGGDGNTCPDGGGAGTATARVRAERSGSPQAPGDGRVYHLSFRASDGRGGACTGEVTVCAPHDQRPGGGCVDQGPLYDSTVCP